MCSEEKGRYFDVDVEIGTRLKTFFVQLLLHHIFPQNTSDSLQNGVSLYLPCSRVFIISLTHFCYIFFKCSNKTNSRKSSTIYCTFCLESWNGNFIDRQCNYLLKNCLFKYWRTDSCIELMWKIRSEKDFNHRNILETPIQIQ